MSSLKAISSEEMKAIEMNAEYFGVSPLQMMENAGNAVAREIAARFNPDNTRVTIIAGTGGNGGDGFVAARHLSNLGYEVSVILVGRVNEIKKEIVKKNWKAIKFMDSVEKVEVHDSSLIPKITGDVVVDALLGTGAKGSLRPPILQVVKALNEAQCFKISVDVPTGLNSDTGKVSDECVKANLTITFHRSKKGLLKAKSFVGELVVANIGLPKDVETCVGPGDVFLIRKPRLPDTYKGYYGRLLIIGGSETYSGAPALSAMAALRVGVDLVYIAAPRETAHDIASFSPNLITVKLEGEHLTPSDTIIINRFIQRALAVVIGPGLGLHRETIMAVKEIVEALEVAKVPLLLDADGIKAFSEFKHRVKTPVIFTPHAGEFKILMGKELPKELGKKVEVVSRAAKELNGVILLKGPVDIISDGKRVKVNEIIHNPGMTVGGTGDVLSGIVGAFLSQGVEPFRAAVAGVFINGAAGDFVAHHRGYHLLPTDIIDWIAKVMDDPMSHISVRRG